MVAHRALLFLITTGLHTSVRHPQFIAGGFMALAVMCITRRWETLAIGAVVLATNQLSMRRASRRLMSKFADECRDYMARVPRSNVVVGIWRLHRQHRI